MHPFSHGCLNNQSINLRKYVCMCGRSRRIKLSFSFYSQTIIACGVSYGFNFNKIYNVDIVGEMVRGYVSVLSAFV